MGFTHAQNSVDGGQFTSGQTTLVLTLGSAPALNDLVIVPVFTSDSPTIPTVTSVIDGNSNAYTKSSGSPNTSSNVGYCYIYYLVAPSNASRTITVTINTALTTSGAQCIAGFVDDFSTGGLALFDKDAKASGTAVTSPTNGPSITPTYTNSLIYAYGIIQSHFTGVVSPWVSNTVGEGTNGDWAEYILSTGSAQTVGLTYTGSEDWGTIAASFFLTAYEDDSWNVFQPPPADQIVSVF